MTSRTGSIVMAVGLAAVVVLASTLSFGVVLGQSSGPSASSAVGTTAIPATTQGDVSEPEFVAPVPEEGDAFFEAAADDGSWISYVNPRDGYRSPYLGDGSGKLCVALVNEEGEPVVGETIPNTTATIETGDELDWHEEANPFVVEFPLTDHYDRPLDADQFGTDPDLPQGDGYLDAHCFEWHGLPEDETVEYGEVELEGDHADDLRVVGYVQQAHEAWETDVDPIADAEPYDAAGGWTYEEGASHGQAVVVIALDRDGDDLDAGDGGTSPDEANDASDDPNETSDESDDEPDERADTTERSTDDENAVDSVPGFGPLLALIAVALAALVGRRR